MSSFSLESLLKDEEVGEEYNPIPLVLLIFVVVYSCIILVAFILVLNFCPARLKQKPTGFVLNLPPVFMDCSFLSTCCPCTDCSFRNFLRSLCPSPNRIDQIKECCKCSFERPDRLDLVCCQV